jgi:hypothetical protein
VDASEADYTLIISQGKQVLNSTQINCKFAYKFRIILEILSVVHHSAPSPPTVENKVQRNAIVELNE